MFPLDHNRCAPWWPFQKLENIFPQTKCFRDAGAYRAQLTTLYNESTELFWLNFAFWKPQLQIILTWSGSIGTAPEVRLTTIVPKYITAFKINSLGSHWAIGTTAIGRVWAVLRCTCGRLGCCNLSLRTALLLRALGSSVVISAASVAALEALGRRHRTAFFVVTFGGSFLIGTAAKEGFVTVSRGTALELPTQGNWDSVLATAKGSILTSRNSRTTYHIKNNIQPRPIRNQKQKSGNIALLSF